MAGICALLLTSKEIAIHGTPFDLPGRAVLQLFNLIPVLKHGRVVDRHIGAAGCGDFQDLAGLVCCHNVDAVCQVSPGIGGFYTDPDAVVLNYCKLMSSFPTIKKELTVALG